MLYDNVHLYGLSNLSADYFNRLKSHRKILEQVCQQVVQPFINQLPPGGCLIPRQASHPALYQVTACISQQTSPIGFHHRAILGNREFDYPVAGSGFKPLPYALRSATACTAVLY